MGKTRIASAVSGVALALGVSVLSATPAFAVNRTDCNQKELLMLVSPSTTCWANRGTVDVRLYGVSVVRTGNNDVDLTFENVGTRFFKRGGEYPFLPGSTIVRINIR